MAISTNQKPMIYRNLYENTGPDVDGVGPALGIQSVLQGNPSIPFSHTNLRAVFWTTFDPDVSDGGYLWYKVLHTAYSFVYVAVYDLEITVVDLRDTLLHTKQNITKLISSHGVLLTLKELNYFV